MKRIGLLSDTHAYWDDRYLQYFESCDEIWHAGDIGSTALADRLAAFRPLRAVVGNCDGGDLRRMFPEVLRWRCEEADVLMTHIGGYPGRYDMRIRRQLIERPPKLFICGHSHILKVQYDRTLGLLHIGIIIQPHKLSVFRHIHLICRQHHISQRKQEQYAK